MNESPLEKLACFHGFQGLSTSRRAGGGDDHVPVQPAPVPEGCHRLIKTIAAPGPSYLLFIKLEPAQNNRKKRTKEEDKMACDLLSNEHCTYNVLYVKVTQRTRWYQADRENFNLCEANIHHPKSNK